MFSSSFRRPVHSPIDPVDKAWAPHPQVQWGRDDYYGMQRTRMESEYTLQTHFFLERQDIFDKHMPTILAALQATLSSQIKMLDYLVAWKFCLKSTPAALPLLFHPNVGFFDIMSASTSPFVLGARARITNPNSSETRKYIFWCLAAGIIVVALDGF